MNENDLKFKEKYLKYKKKYYLAKQFKLNGGLIATSTERNYYCEDRLYFPKICPPEHPCLDANGFCYNKENQADIKKKFPLEFLKKIFSTEINSKNLAVVVRIFSHLDLNFDFIIDKHVLSGGESSVFRIRNIRGNELDLLLKLSIKSNLRSKYNNARESLIISSKEKFNKKREELVKELNENKISKERFDNILAKISNDYSTAFIEQASKFTNEEKYRDFKRVNFQYSLRKEPFINKIIDFGRYKITLNNSDFERLDLVSPINCKGFATEKCLPLTSFEGSYQIVEECKGGDLWKVLSNLAAINFNYSSNKKLLKNIVKNLLTGLKSIHEKNMVHLDIKSENIGLSKKINYQQIDSEVENLAAVEILDFGLCMKVGERIPFVGTKKYLSPDFQSIKYTDGKKFVTFKDDIYSMGILIFEIIHKHMQVNGEVIDFGENLIYLINGNEVTIETSFILDEDYYESLFLVVIYNKIKHMAPIKLNWIEDNKFQFKLVKDSDLSFFKNCDRFIIYSQENVINTPVSSQINLFNDFQLDDQFIDLLSKMLEIEEDDRFDVNEALEHPYLKNIDESEETTESPRKKIKIL